MSSAPHRFRSLAGAAVLAACCALAAAWWHTHGPAKTGRADVTPQSDVGPPIGLARSAASGPGVVAGRAYVEGRPPSVPLVFSLVEHPVSDPDSDLDRRRRGATGGAPELRVATDRRGDFRFDGLPDGWSGSLLLPPGYAEREDRASGATPRRSVGIALPRPESGLRIHLLPLPELTGRVVTGQGRVPVARARIEQRARRANRHRFERAPAPAGPDGRFRLRQLDDADELVLRVSDADGRNARSHRFAREALVPDVNGQIALGDLSLGSGEKLELRVVDHRGAPVSDARVRAQPSDAEGTHRTDSDGRAELDVDRAQLSGVAVDAVGFWGSLAAPPERFTDPFEIALDPENALELQVTGGRGEPAAGVRVALERRDGPLFAIRSRDGGFAAVPHDTGFGWWSGESSESTAAAGQGRLAETRHGRERTGLLSGERLTDAEGRAVFRRLWPGSAFQLRVRDKTGAVLIESELRELGVAEIRLESVYLDAEPHVLSGWVTDRRRRPIEDVAVVLGTETTSPVAHTDQRGRFRIDALYSDTAALALTRPGYASLVRELALPTRNAEPRFELEPGRSISVGVVDPRSGRLSGFSVEAFVGEQRVGTARPIDRFTVAIDDLPEGRVTLYVDGAGGRRLAQLEHHTRESHVEIQAPEHGRLRAEWELPDDVNPGSLRLVLRAPLSGVAHYSFAVPAHGKRRSELEATVAAGTYHAVLEDSAGRALTRERRVVVDSTGISDLRLSFL